MDTAGKSCSNAEATDPSSRLPRHAFRRPRDGGEVWVFPASAAQQVLWFMGTDESVFPNTVSLALELRGAFSVDHLQSALAGLVAMHEALRTTLSVVDGELCQIVHSRGDCPLRVSDLNRTPEPSREDVERALCNEAVRTRFDIEAGPLVAAHLIRRSTTEHLLIITVHRAVADEESLNGPIASGVCALYDAALSARTSSLTSPLGYVDFTVHPRRRATSTDGQATVAWWVARLAGAPRRVPLAHDRQGAARLRRAPAAEQMAVAGAPAGDLEGYAADLGVSVEAVLLAALSGALAAWTEQREVVVGVRGLAKRPGDAAGVVGPFVTVAPIRATLEPDSSFGAVVLDLYDKLIEAAPYADAPLHDVAQTLWGSPATPLHNVTFQMRDAAPSMPRSDSLEVTACKVWTEAHSRSDLLFTAAKTDEGYALACEYDARTFDAATVRELVGSWANAAVEGCRVAGAPAVPNAPKPLRDQAHRAARRAAQAKVVVAATFTAEPIADSFEFWQDVLAEPFQVEFAPYNQVFQQLLDPTSALSRNSHGINAVLVRFCDWGVGGGIDGGDPDQVCSELLDCLKSYGGANLLVVACPEKPKLRMDLAIRDAIAAAWSRIKDETSAMSNVRVLTVDDVARLYSVAVIDAEGGEDEAKIPYSSEQFAALATVVVRRAMALRRAPVKVLVLDCDETLWGGVAGEDGPRGVRFEARHLALQRFAVEQQNAGVVVCLCSKNEPGDVEAVFEVRGTEMPLRPEHVTAKKVNWRSKAENIQELATDLNLGLSSFVFIDDNPIECAEIQARLPEVMMLRFPNDGTDVEEWLRHVWAFDRHAVTAEDRARTALYRDNIRREEVQRSSAGLADFLAKLELRIDCVPLRSDHVPRVAQLTNRTNQFNCTTRRLTEADVLRLPDTHVTCVVHVRDRFGDYGLVGFASGVVNAGTLRVDLFLLSCRAMGRGVEHRMLATLNEMGAAAGVEWVELEYRPTAKNEPAKIFLDSLGATAVSGEEGVTVYRLSLAESELAAGRPRVIEPPKEENQDKKEAQAKAAADAAKNWQAMAVIAARFRNAAEIAVGVDGRAPPRARRVAASFETPRSDVERRCATIWARCLRVDRVGVHDDFQDLGGTSLCAAQIAAYLREALGVTVTLRDVLECRTVAKLAARLASGTGESRRASAAM